MLGDVVYTLRTLRRSPMFTAVAVLSLALGIGANTAIFSLLDQVVLRSLPVRDPERLVVLHRTLDPNGTDSKDNPETVFSYPMYREIRDNAGAFDGVIARMSAAVRIAWHGSTDADRAELVSTNFFSTLGIPAAAGRTIQRSDEGAPGASPIAVLSYSYWVSRFAAAPSAIGQKIAINGVPFTVIGVADSRFHGLIQGDSPAVFVPISMQRAIMPAIDILQERQYRWLNVFARLKPGDSLAHAQSAVRVLFHRLVEAEASEFTSSLGSDRARQAFFSQNIDLRPAAQGISALREKWESPLRILSVMVGLVLLIACANVAGLMVARATGRRREIAIRLAMGAKRGALIKQLLLEGLVLSFAGGALGLIVERWSTAALIGVLPRDAFNDWISPSLDAAVFLYAFALSAASGVLFALVPGLQATRTDLASSLKTQAANLSGPSAPARLRQSLVIAQVALSMMLAIGAGLFSSSAANLLHADLGFRSRHLLVFNVNAALDRTEVPSALAFYRDLQDRLRGIPGVTGVGAANSGLFGGGTSSGNITIDGYHARENENMNVNLVAVSPGFFQAVGIPLRSGRELTRRDESTGGVKPVLVNEAFASRFLGAQAPVGRVLMFGASNHPHFDHEIVGVAADSRSKPQDKVNPTIYYSYAEWKRPDRLTYFVRSAGDQAALPPAIRQAVRAADPDLPVTDIQTAEINVRNSLYAERLIAILAAAFGVLATVLASIGLYGVMAYAVARRTGEIGVRMAMGALPRSVLAMVLKEAGRLALTGIAIGLFAAFALGRLIESQLFGIKASNPFVYAAATLALAAAALIAAAVPGWRAARIDPVVALKYE